MSYAGITKGTTAIASAMLLGAARFGCEKALVGELTESQPEMLARFRQASRDVRQGLSLGRRDAGNLRLSRTEPTLARHVRRLARLYEYLAAAYDEKDPGPDNADKTLDRVLGKG